MLLILAMHGSEPGQGGEPQLPAMSMAGEDQAKARGKGRAGWWRPMDKQDGKGGRWSHIIEEPIATTYVVGTTYEELRAVVRSKSDALVREEGDPRFVPESPRVSRPR